MNTKLFNGYKTLLLDMNDTFMFGGDRFGEGHDYYPHYKSLGGRLQRSSVNVLINSVYDYLLIRYPDPKYRESFPHLDKTFINVTNDVSYDSTEFEILINTFSHHELGRVSAEYSEVLKDLSKKYKLGLVADIWSHKQPWIEEFERAGILNLFEFMSFSSDTGIVKPSAKPFLNALKTLNSKPDQTLVVGDSPRRDLGGAQRAGLNCVLVGGKTHFESYAEFQNLLEFADTIL